MIQHIHILPPSLEFLDRSDLRLFKEGLYRKLIDNVQKKRDVYGPNSMLLMGWLLLVGKGVSRNTDESIKCFHDAIELGESDGYYYLGLICHRNGDYKSAAENYTRHIEEGGSNAYYELGMLSLHGKGLDQDIKKAYQLFTLAESKNNVFAAKARAYLLINELVCNGIICRISGYLLLLKTAFMAAKQLLKNPFQYDGL